MRYILVLALALISTSSRAQVSSQDPTEELSQDWNSLLITEKHVAEDILKVTKELKTLETPPKTENPNAPTK